MNCSIGGDFGQVGGVTFAVIEVGRLEVCEGSGGERVQTGAQEDVLQVPEASLHPNRGSFGDPGAVRGACGHYFGQEGEGGIVPDAVAEGRKRQQRVSSRVYRHLSQSGLQV